jgi:phosphotransferase system enzyme I (PtsI)
MVLKGIAVSPGVVHGTAYVLAAAQRRTVPRRQIAIEEVAHHLERFEAALVTAEEELLALEESLTKVIGPGEAAIFRAQALLVRSSELLDPVRTLVREQRVNIEAALAETIGRLTQEFEAVRSPLVRARAADIRDVGKRLLSLLAPEHREGDAGAIPEHAIIVAEELLPSVTARLELHHVSALVSERGGASSHASILARAQGLPAVTGIEGAVARIKTGDPVIVDGISGVVFVHPDAAVQREYQGVEAQLRSHREELGHLIDLPSVTLDGTRVPLLANINKFADTEAAFGLNPDGIGLYRTEFGFSVRGTFPTDD